MLLTGLILILSGPMLETQSHASIDAALPGLRQHVRDAWESLPNIVCDEELRWSGQVVESEFTSVRQRTPLGHSIIESRQLKTIDGKAVPNGRRFEGPFRSNGNYVAEYRNCKQPAVPPQDEVIVPHKPN